MTKRDWLERRYGETPERPARFSTVSDMVVEPLYTAEDAAGPDARIGLPGEYPYTRGPYPSMYRGRLWTMRQFAGFGSAADTNARFHFLLEHGQHGLSTAFDMPTLMGYDADHPRARGEVGREGVAVSTLDDVRALFDGIDLSDVTTSMTVNCTASVLLAMYLAVADEHGVPWSRLGGTIQNDMLKEFIAQKEWICPPEPSMRIVVDMIEFCAQHAPRWHPVSISGYHIREAGSTAVQELAFTLADGIAYVQAGVERGLAGGRLRAAPLVLLQPAQRFPRRDREAPRGAPHVGHLHARAVRRARTPVAGCSGRMRRPPARRSPRSSR